MATPGDNKETGSKTKFKFKIKLRNSGDDGAAGTPPSPPSLPPLPRLSSPSHSPYRSFLRASSLPLLRAPPPAPAPADKKNDYEKEKLRRSADKRFYSTLLMSVGKNIPHYIVRYDSVLLNKHTYFSLRKKWNQLLDGKRTYLRPERDRRIPNDLFKCPDARPRTLGCQEPLLTLVQNYPNKSFAQQMIQILCHHYVFFRRTRVDGCCFYRAFFFSYLENLGQLQDSQAEVTRLLECVTMSKENFCRLKWDKAYFRNPEEYFSSVFSEFEHLVSSVANGLTSNELYKRNLEEMMSLRILSFLRLITETEIRTHEEDYKSLIPNERSVLQFCRKEVRPMDAEAMAVPMRALSYALGIPMRIEAVGSRLTNGAIQVKRLDFFPRSEQGKGDFDSVITYISSTAIPEPLDRLNGNPLSSNGTPLLALLRRYKSCDILYRKVNKQCKQLLRLDRKSIIYNGTDKHGSLM